VGALFWRGFSSFQIGAFANAVTDFQQAGAIAPKSTLYPGWEAIAFIRNGDLVKGKEAIDRAFAMQADNAVALAARASLRLAAGELEDAEADLASLARRGPLGTIELQTQQLIMIHRAFKPSDPPVAPPKQ
jgi:Flp pilus assembly protein TadD